MMVSVQKKFFIHGTLLLAIPHHAAGISFQPPNRSNALQWLHPPPACSLLCPVSYTPSSEAPPSASAFPSGRWFRSVDPGRNRSAEQVQPMAQRCRRGDSSSWPKVRHSGTSCPHCCAFRSIIAPHGLHSAAGTSIHGIPVRHP